MNDCVLINPRSITFTKAQAEAPYLYAGLLSIGSLLRSRGWGATILDMVVEEDPLEALALAAAGERAPLLFGLSVMTTQVPHAIELSRVIRERWPRSTIVWGGIHPSLFPEEVLREGVADCVCTGEGEYTALELLEALRDGTDRGAVKGLCFLDAGALVRTGTRPPAPLDDFPHLDYSLVRYPRYRDRIVSRGEETLAVRFGIVVTGFGCPYRCAFCINSNRKLFFGTYRRKSPRRIVDEIERLMREHGVDFFDFIDENFFVSRAHVEAFADEVERRGLAFRWFTNIRADAIARGIADAGLFARLARIGLYRLAIGAESGAQTVLDKLKKDIRVEQIPQSVEQITRAGIGVTCSFMMGTPGERREDLMATLALIERLRSLGSTVSIIGPQIFRPYPGGELYEECIEKYGYRPPQTLAEWGAVVDQLSGFESVDKLPWIEDRALLERISFSLEFVNLSVASLKVGAARRAALRLMQLISRLRLRLGFWSFPVEMAAVLLVKRLRRRAGRSGG